MILPLSPTLTNLIAILSKQKCIFLYYCVINNARKIVFIIRQTRIYNWIRKIGHIIKNLNISKPGCWIGCPPAFSHWPETEVQSMVKKKKKKKKNTTFFNTYFQILKFLFLKSTFLGWIHQNFLETQAISMKLLPSHNNQKYLFYE